jgi:hypothetical protein
MSDSSSDLNYRDPESFYSGAILECHTNDTPPKEPEKAKKCNFSILKIQNGKRVYDSSKNQEGYFAIVCGEKNTYGRVKIDTVNLIGPPSPSKNSCNHKNKVFDVDFSNKKHSDSHIDFDATTNFKEQKEFFENLGPMLWPPSAKPNKYYVAANTCGNHQSLNIIAYPDLSTKLSIEGKNEGGLEFVLIGDGSEKSVKKFFDVFENPSKYFEAIFESKYDGEVLYHLSLSNYQDQDKFTKLPSLQRLKVLYNGVFKMSDILNPVLSKGKGTLKLFIKPGFSYNCSRMELLNSVDVDYDANLKVGFDPLLKLTGDYDFAGPVLGSIPGIGTALLAITWLFKKCEAGEVSLKFGTSGSISINGSINRANQQWECNLEPKGKVEFKFEFKAEYKLTIDYGFGVLRKNGKFQAIAKSGIKSQPKKDKDKKYKIDDTGIYIYMDVVFTGAELYYLKGTKNGTTTKMPGNAPLYVQQQIDDTPDDDDSEGIPDDQKYVIWSECTISSMSGYFKLISGEAVTSI